jgi:integrase
MRTTQRPATGLYGSDGRRKYLTRSERQRFMRAAWLADDPRVRSFCLVLAYTGCRISEALNLKGRDINPEEGFIAFRSLKKRGVIHVREVPIPRYLASLLSATHDLSRASDARPWSWSRSTAWKAIKHLMVIAEIPPGPHMTAKGLRHAFGIEAIRCGIPLNIVQRWLGHASIATTSIYTQALGLEERELAARMWGRSD